MLLKVTGKTSLDRNARYSSVHRLLDYYYCTVLLSLLSPHRPSILANMDIDWFNWIK